MRSAAHAAILFGMLTSMAGCDSSSGKGDGTETPDIVGHISSVFESSTEPGTGSVLIERPRREGVPIDRAAPRVSAQTVIIDATIGDSREAPFDFLAAGQRAKAAITGPVMESYPVQATASRITVLEDVSYETVCISQSPLSPASLARGARDHLKNLALTGVDGEILRENLVLLETFNTLIKEAAKDARPAILESSIHRHLLRFSNSHSLAAWFQQPPRFSHIATALPLFSHE